jgi:phage-related tail fiber protein
LGKELVDAQTLVEETSSQFNHESKALKMTIKVEAEKNMKLSEALRALKERCFNFASQCTTRLKSIFNSAGAASEEASFFAEDIPGALERVDKEVDVLDVVITGHGDFCALVASRGTATAFIKVGCNHARAVNRPNFSLTSSDLVDVPAEARSIGNRFITQIWAKGGRELAGDEAETCLTKYSSLPLFFYLAPYQISDYLVPRYSPG